ncbi:MAG: RNA methyltransferase [Bacteroidetes bacterium]|nr:RNA methyltransferase [Bacteroidota bacterium]
MLQIPEQLLNSLKNNFNINVNEFVAAHNEENKLTSIRINPFKKTEIDYNLRQVNWCKNGFYLKERPYFTYDPLFHAGCYYVQEAGSMFIDYVLNEIQFPKQNVNVLDACAAPGGKSTLINSYLAENSLLISNEFTKSRAEILSYNLSKWGTCNTIVTNSETNKFKKLQQFFDLVLVDAPCSGSGLFRKQHDAIEHWSEKAVTDCSIRQKEIISNLIECIKPGGYLIYSTCSYSIEENEQISKWLVTEFDFEEIKLNVPIEWGITQSELGYRFYPHLTNSEGFYICIFQKKEETIFSTSKNKKNNLCIPTNNERKLLNDFVSPNFSTFKLNHLFYFSTDKVIDFINAHSTNFYLKKAGTCIGEIKGKDLIPHHELALSNYLNSNLNKVDLELTESINYLKKENLNLSTNTKGLTLLTFKNFGIGWCKILPNRTNNYLPNEFKIIK